MSNFPKRYLAHKFLQNFTCVFTILVEFCYYIYSPYKMTKNKLFTQLVQGFCRLKIKITQFPGEVNVAKLSNRLRLGDYSKLVYTHSVIVVIQAV